MLNKQQADPDSQEFSVAPVKPVSNAVRILRHLSEVGHAATVTEIARELHINPSTCFGILRTLVAERVLNFDPRSKCYSIGLGIVTLAERALSEDGKIDIVRPHFQRIADAFDISLTLWSLALRDRLMLTCVVQSPADLQIQLRLGQRLPLLHGAAGRLIAQSGKMTKDEVRERFRKLHWEMAPSFEDYWAQSMEASQRGWAIDDGNFARGVLSIAVPVCRRSGDISHALVATMLKGRHDEAETPQVAQAMQTVCKEIGAIF